MKKQIISLLLIAVMAAMFLPTVAFADYYGTQCRSGTGIVHR